MEIISERFLSTVVINVGEEESLSKSQIYLKDQASETIVTGAVLEICIKVGEFFLVFMTDDIPNEDMLRIYLIEQDASVLDSVVLGSPYSTGSFQLLDIVEPNLITFNFIGSTVWKAFVFNQRKLNIPFITDPVGVSRRLSFGCFLKIEGTPNPEPIA